MSAIDDVRGAPGGGELADLARKLVGNPGAITSAANAWRTAAGTCQEHTGALSAVSSDLDGAWEGVGADAFAGYMTKVVDTGDRLRQTLQECAGHLDTAAQKLQGAESEALEICGGYAAAARELRGRDPRPTEDQVAQSLQPALGEARSRLQRLVGDTASTMTDSAGKIRGSLDKIRKLPGELPEPDTQPFAPAQGKPLGWSPARLDGQNTALAGTSPGSGSGSGTVGFGGYGPSGPPPPGGGPAPQGQVADWINQAIAILKQHGVPADKMNPNDIWMIIKHESGGNPSAINNWDSNAAKGTPSKGLMQTIDPTFSSYKLPGHGDIYNPVDNIIAGVRYAISRYGSVSNVPGVVGMKTGGGYQGY
ncbi:transglycosylase SLT domain-containing protein [Nonomuraea sp. NPDC050643]|uniref:transglycosylase SLT domain-containing protein n=1 Tax=Nonomuraea sp. NPDC050643 TaxID=3155660 RepID=UPI003406B392